MNSFYRYFINFNRILYAFGVVEKGGKYVYL